MPACGMTGRVQVVVQKHGLDMQAARMCKGVVLYQHATVSFAGVERTDGDVLVGAFLVPSAGTGPERPPR